MNNKFGWTLLIGLLLTQAILAITTLRDNELYFDEGFIITDTLDSDLESLASDICYDTTDFSICDESYYSYVTDIDNSFDIGTINIATYLGTDETEKIEINCW